MIGKHAVVPNLVLTWRRHEADETGLRVGHRRPRAHPAWRTPSTSISSTAPNSTRSGTRRSRSSCRTPTTPMASSTARWGRSCRHSPARSDAGVDLAGRRACVVSAPVGGSHWGPRRSSARLMRGAYGRASPPPGAQTAAARDGARSTPSSGWMVKPGNAGDAHGSPRSRIASARASPKSRPRAKPRAWMRSTASLDQHGFGGVDDLRFDPGGRE